MYRFLLRTAGLLMVLSCVLQLQSAPAFADQWALLVGINNYQSIPKLRGCENDVELMRHLLIRNCGLAPDHVMVLDESQATRAGLEKAFTEWLVSKPRNGDTAIFYYSGHGTRVDEGTETHEAICPIDTNVDKPSSLLLDRDLSAMVSRSPAAQVVLILDSCHSGTNVRGVSLLSTPRFVRMNVGAPKNDEGTAPFTKTRELLGHGKTILMAACKVTQVAEEKRFSRDGKEYSDGAFTYALSEILGRMDPASASQTAYQVVMDRVTQLMQEELEVRQTPVIQGDFQGKGLFKPPGGGSQPTAPNSEAVTAPPVVLPPAEDRPMAVLVVPLSGGAASAKSIGDALSQEPYLQVVATGTYADRVVRAGNGEARVEVPDGTVLNTFRSSSSTDLANLVRGELRRAYTFTWLARLQNPSTAFHVSVSTEKSSYAVGEKVRFVAKADRDCYLTLIDVGTSGNITILFPNQWNRNNFIHAGDTVLIPSDKMGFDITASEPRGQEMVKAIATLHAVDLAAMTTQDKEFKSFDDVLAFRKSMITSLARGFGFSGSMSNGRDIVIVPAAKAESGTWAAASTVLKIR